MSVLQIPWIEIHRGRFRPSGRCATQTALFVSASSPVVSAPSSRNRNLSSPSVEGKKYIFYVHESMLKAPNKTLINFNEKIYYLYTNRFSLHFKTHEMSIFGELYCIYTLKLMCISKIKYTMKKSIDALEYMVCKTTSRAVSFG